MITIGEFNSLGFLRSVTCEARYEHISIHKNMARDGSGDFDGYLVQDVRLSGGIGNLGKVHTIKELEILMLDTNALDTQLGGG